MFVGGDHDAWDFRISAPVSAAALNAAGKRLGLSDGLPGGLVSFLFERAHGDWGGHLKRTYKTGGQ